MYSDITTTTTTTTTVFHMPILAELISDLFISGTIPWYHTLPDNCTVLVIQLSTLDLFFYCTTKQCVSIVLQVDQVDAVTLELVECEMTELLTEFGFDAQKTPIISGSALCALEDRDPELGEKCIRKLLSAVDEHIVPPSRNLDGPFILPIEKAFTVPGRGTVAIGTLACGVINKGDIMELIGCGNRLKTAASDVQV